MRPPCCSTMPRQMYSPSPRPAKRRSSTFAARWKRSKMWARSAAGMPMPSSATLSRATSPSSRQAATRTSPPSGLYFTAFSSRFSTSWSIRVRSYSPATHSAASRTKRCRSAACRAMVSRASSTRSTRSSGPSSRPCSTREASSRSTTRPLRRRASLTSRWMFLTSGGAAGLRSARRWSSSAEATRVVSGVLRSCAAAERKSSFRRVASSRARTRAASSISARLSKITAAWSASSCTRRRSSSAKMGARGA